MEYLDSNPMEYLKLVSETLEKEEEIIQLCTTYIP